MSLSNTALKRRKKWLDEIVQLSGQFGPDGLRIQNELKNELVADGAHALLDHLHLCGTIPERYRHDSSEEKLYSKYTDALLATVLGQMGMDATVLTERADAADVEAIAGEFSLVGDAKAFRLSRTAKNQKDFKVEALHGWRRQHTHAMVVCPAYQLPTSRSQIYQQAIARNVCIFSYSHLAVLLRFSKAVGNDLAQQLLNEVFRCTESLNPEKDAIGYWTLLNRTMLDFREEIPPLWEAEKLAIKESLKAAKEEGLAQLSLERERIMRMTRDEAVASLIKSQNLKGKEQKIESARDNGLLAIG